MHFNLSVVTVCLMIAPGGPLPTAGEEILTVLGVPNPENDLHAWVDWNDGGWMLNQHLYQLAGEAIDRREANVAALRTAGDWRLRQAEIRQYFGTHLGPWPEKTPLNVEVTGTIEKDGYRVEKIVFESMPGFHVTGALFCHGAARVAPRPF